MPPCRAGAAGFAPAGPAHLADGLRFARRRAGGNAISSQKLRFCTWLFGGCASRTVYSRGLPGPDPGHFSLAGKVPKRAPAPFGLDPGLCLIGRPRWNTEQPLNVSFTSGFLVIGAVVCQLRLSALGMIGTSGRAKRIDSSVSLTGRQPKLDKIPATDQIPEGFSCSVAPHHLSLIVTD